MFGIVSPPLCYIQTHLYIYVGVHEIKMHALAQTNTRARAFSSRVLTHHTLSGPDTQKVSDVQASNLYGNFISNFRIKLSLQAYKCLNNFLNTKLPPFVPLSLCLSVFMSSFSLHNILSTSKNVVFR